MPGTQPYEERGYWRDVGTLESFWSSHMDLLGEKPRLDLHNDDWPINAGPYRGPSARSMGGHVYDAIVSEGAVIHDAVVRHSVIGRGVIIHPGSVIENSVIMDHCEVGSHTRIQRAIVDRFNAFPSHTLIGYDPAKDKAAGRHIDKSGLVAIGRGRSKWAHLKR